MALTAWFECFSGCGVRYSLEEILYRCPKCGSLLEVRHDVAALQSRPGKEWKELFDARMGRESGVWSRKEVVLPELRPESIVSLGEGNSPLIRSEALAREFGVAEVRVKQCGTSHTGSFKDLGMTVLVSMVNQIRSKVRAVACASTGDTSAALSAYCAAAGLPSIVFLPKDKVSLAQLIQPIANGAITLSIDTDFDGCMKIVQEITRDGSIYLANSMNSLRVEGQKTISFEIAQQLNWEVPDFVVVPGGNLGNVSAIANGFVLMKQMGLVERIPRLVCAQTERANPFYKAYVHGFERLDAMTAGNTLATAIQIGNPVSFPKAIVAMKQTNGIVEEVTEAELANAANQADRFGFFNDPQTGVALAATAKLVRSGSISKSSKIVVISTAHGLKFIDFKLRFHRRELTGTSADLANLPIEVPSNPDAIRAVIDSKLPV
ncbi:MAG TPA: threonine synthase [Terriglobia bacterium]|nr:threonine synthase [Terriglobia bacterium]